MKFTYSWLKDYCPCDLPVKELVALLTNHGVKVENHEPTPNGKDTVITLEITANRPDCLSLIGVARELALLTGQKFHPKMPPDQKIPKAGDKFISINNPDLCPVYVGRIIKGVKVGPSPQWLRERVESIGLRSVNNVVDITNFVLYETGQPLHAFDYNALEGRQIIVRLAQPGEKIQAIDGKEYQLAKDTLVIADARKPVAIAGIMGGKQTEVVERTTDILLESAYFNPGNIRKSSRWLKLASDSSYRFERGVAAEMITPASDRAVELILSTAGGKLVGHQEVNHLKPKTKRLNLRLERLERVLGIGIAGADVKRILKGLGFVIKKEWKGQIETEVPAFRQDISIEEDVIEEIARVIGYDNIPAEPPVMQMRARTPDKLAEVTQAARQVLYGLGYNEVMTDSLKPAQEQVGLIGLLDTENSISKYLRHNLIDGLYQVYTLNENYQKGVPLKLFEISKAYWMESGSPKEQLRLGLLDSAGYGSLKGTVTVLFSKLGLDRQVPQPDTKMTVATCELDFEEIVQQSRLIRRYQEFSRMPAISRDLAIVVSDDKPWDNIAQVVREALQPTQSELPLESLDFFDIYRGKQIPAGKKSIAFSMTFRHPTKTLSATRADEVMTSVISALQKDLNATIR